MLASDFPKSLVEFNRRFGSEDQCREYLLQMRWPNGFTCPGRPDSKDTNPDPSARNRKSCGCAKGWWHERRDIWTCSACGYQCSIRVGTVMEKSKMPLTTWFLALYHVTTSKQGISALELQRVLGFGSYETAWTWLHKIREYMALIDQEDLLGPVVELDETFIGGKIKRSQTSKMGRGTDNKITVLAAAERNKKHWRVRFWVPPDVSAPTVQKFVTKSIKHGSMVIVDAFGSYIGLASNGFYLDVAASNQGKKAKKSGDEKHPSIKHQPHLHDVFMKLKKILGATFQDSYSEKHMQKLLDEYAFRYNRRDADIPGLIFQELCGLVVLGRPSRNWEIVGRPDPSTPIKPKPSNPFYVLLADRIAQRRQVAS